MNQIRGSIRRMTDMLGRTAKAYQYDAYGAILAEQGPSLTDEFAYTARRLHDRSGLYYYRARFYSPELGRFITQDPIGHAGGVNLYGYATNSPVNHTDPLGLFFEKIWNDPAERAYADMRYPPLTMEQFLQFAEGKSLEQLQKEAGKGYLISWSDQGPNTKCRYVVNPKDPAQIIDMRHFLVLGPLGEIAGLGAEVAQSIPFIGDKKSAFHAQDFLSNALGADFFGKYDSSAPLTDQLEDYFFGGGLKCSNYPNPALSGL